MSQHPALRMPMPWTLAINMSLPPNRNTTNLVLARNPIAQLQKKRFEKNILQLLGQLNRSLTSLEPIMKLAHENGQSPLKICLDQNPILKNAVIRIIDSNSFNECVEFENFSIYDFNFLLVTKQCHELFEKVLEKYNDPSKLLYYENQNKETLLSIAIRTKKPEIISYFIKQGLHPSAKDLALASKDFEALLTLIDICKQNNIPINWKQGADIYLNLSKEERESLEKIGTIEEDFLEGFQALSFPFQKEYFLNALKVKNTYLAVKMLDAAKEGFLDRIDLTPYKGTEDEEGNTLLDYACSYASPSSIFALFKKQENPYKINKKNIAPIEILFRKPEILKVLTNDYQVSWHLPRVIPFYYKAKLENNILNILEGTRCHLLLAITKTNDALCQVNGLVFSSRDPLSYNMLPLYLHLASSYFVELKDSCEQIIRCFNATTAQEKETFLKDQESWSLQTAPDCISLKKGNAIYCFFLENNRIILRRYITTSNPPVCDLEHQMQPPVIPISPFESILLALLLHTTGHIEAAEKSLAELHNYVLQKTLSGQYPNGDPLPEAFIESFKKAKNKEDHKE